MGTVLHALVMGVWREGVSFFFAISGLLICTRLLEEEQKTGTLHLKGFYLRRVLRIQPASLLFLAVVLVIKLAGVVTLSWTGFFAALLLVRNYFPWHTTASTDWVTLHFWSLSVEEHFYLILPGLLLLAKRRREMVLLGAIGLGLAWSTLATREGWLYSQSFHRTDLRICALLIPAFAAVLLRRARFREAVERYLPPWLAILLTLLIMVPVLVGYRHAIRSLPYVAPTIAVLSTMMHPKSWTGRLLEWRPLKFVGRISYGLYLWQQLFFTGHFAPEIRLLGPVSAFPLNLVAVTGLAIGSYYLVEKPCMKLGHKLAHPAVEGRPELRPEGMRA